MKTEMATGAPGFYRDKEGKTHFLSRELGEENVISKDWVEISKEEATTSSKRGHHETVGSSYQEEN